MILKFHQYIISIKKINKKLVLFFSNPKYVLLRILSLRYIGSPKSQYPWNFYLIYTFWYIIFLVFSVGMVGFAFKCTNLKVHNPVTLIKKIGMKLASMVSNTFDSVSYSAELHSILFFCIASYCKITAL